MSFYLARSANLPTGLYILLALISFFFLNWAKLSQDLMDRFSRSFHQVEGICVNVVNPVHFFQFLKGRCHGNQFSSKNGAKLPTPCTYRSAIPKWKWFTYRWWICTLFSNFVKGRFHGNQIILPLWRQADTTCILCTFARWEHGVGLLLLARGRHCGTERAIR